VRVRSYTRVAGAVSGAPSSLTSALPRERDGLRVTYLALHDVVPRPTSHAASLTGSIGFPSPTKKRDQPDLREPHRSRSHTAPRAQDQAGYVGTASVRRIRLRSVVCLVLFHNLLQERNGPSETYIQARMGDNITWLFSRGWRGLASVRAGADSGPLHSRCSPYSQSGGYDTVRPDRGQTLPDI
jgi:hypothetical protein